MNTQKLNKSTVFSGYPEPLECDSKRTKLLAGAKSTYISYKKSNIDNSIEIIKESLQMNKI